MRTHHAKTAQRQPSSAGTVRAGLEHVARVLRQPGEPLAPTLRASLEPRFSHDFSRVRVHRDARAAASAESLGAAAYTVGEAIVFGRGQYRPDAPAGRWLVAHELTHTLQQRGPAAGPLELGDAAGPGEAAATRSARAVMAGGLPDPGPRLSPRVQRQPLGQVHSSPSLGEDLASEASPFMAAVLGSTTLAGFATGSARLTAAHQQEIHRLARVLVRLFLRYPLSTVRVIGHSDTVGAASANRTVGQARADAVKAALVKEGIAESALTTASAGEGSPQLVPTRDEVPEAGNRGVEVRFSARGLPGGGSLLGKSPQTSSVPGPGSFLGQPSLFPPAAGGQGTTPAGLPGFISPPGSRQIPAPSQSLEEALGGLVQHPLQAEDSRRTLGLDFATGATANAPSLATSPTTVGVTVVWRNANLIAGDDKLPVSLDVGHEPNVSVILSPDPKNAQLYQLAVTLVNLHLRRHRQELVEIGLQGFGGPAHALDFRSGSGGVQVQLELHLTSKFSLTTGTSFGVGPHSSGAPDPGSILLGTGHLLGQVDWTWTPFTVGAVYHLDWHRKKTRKAGQPGE